MDVDLQYLIHFFSDKDHLFKTINMAWTDQIDAISDQIASNLFLVQDGFRFAEMSCTMKWMLRSRAMATSTTCTLNGHRGP
jgi:hypothetical protein